MYDMFVAHSNTFITLFKIIGETNQAKLYEALLFEGPLNVSELSRKTSIERTLTYRLLEKLKRKGLVYQQQISRGYLYHASSLSVLETYTERKKQETEKALQNLESIRKQLDNKQDSQTTKVNVYAGLDGVKQLLWNQTQAKTEVLSLLSDNIQSHLGTTFFERWVDTMNHKNIVSRSLIDEHFIGQQTKYYGGVFKASLEHWTAKKLPQNLSSHHRTTIYDQTVTYFDWEEGDIFGVEIINGSIAAAQRQYFELLWNISLPLPNISTNH